MTQETLNISNDFETTTGEQEFLNILEGADPVSSTEPQLKEQSTPRPNLDNFEPGPQPPPPNPFANGTNVKAGDLISGELAAEMLDKVGSVLAIYGAKQFLGLQINRNAFKLSASEKNTLAPILDKCLASLDVSFENPWIALVMSVSVIYGTKFLEVTNNPEMAQPLKKAAKVATKQAAAVHSENFVSTRKPGETRGRKPKIRV